MQAENKEMEVTLELHRTMSKPLSSVADEDDDLYESDSSEEEGKYKQIKETGVNADVVKAMPAFPSSMRSSRFKTTTALNKPSALRKVKSMDTRKSNYETSRASVRSVEIDPYDIVRTWSKSVIRAAQSEDQPNDSKSCVSSEMQ